MSGRAPAAPPMRRGLRPAAGRRTAANRGSARRTQGRRPAPRGLGRPGWRCSGWRAIQGRPRTQASPSTRAVTPRPCASRRSWTARRSSYGTRAARARLTGWLLPAPRLPARRTTARSVPGSAGSTSVTARRAQGQRAGLVDHDAVDSGEFLDERDALEQDSVAAGNRDGSDGGRGRRQNESAWARGDEHGQHRRGVIGRQPCRRRQHQRQRQIAAGIPLQQPGQGWLRPFSLLHERGDLAERRRLRRHR